MALDKRLINVILVGFAFMFTFMAFQTMGNIEQTILDSVSKQDPDFHGNGYTSLAIIYIVLAVCNWLAPSVIAVIGPKFSMIIGSVTYLFFIMTFLLPLTWLLYVASVVIGIGAALIWTGQGNYLTLNSTKATISRNSGIFWAMLQCSMLIGNLFIFLKFGDTIVIDSDLRNLVVWVLSALAMIGLGVFVILPRPPNTDDQVRVEEPAAGPIEVLKGAAELFITPRMLLLSLTFLYSGLELGFYSGVYSSSIGFTLSIPSSKKLVGLSGVFVGIGEVLGGCTFGILGSKTAKWGRDPIVIAGFVLHLVSFFAIFINLPNNSPFGDTKDEAFITSSAYLAMACSFMLGLGDACFNTQFYSILGSVYADNSAPAFGLFKFAQSLAAAASFFYAPYVPLYGQLGILVVMSILGTVSYVFVEYKLRRERTLEGPDTASNTSRSDS